MTNANHAALKRLTQYPEWDQFASYLTGERMQIVLNRLDKADTDREVQRILGVREAVLWLSNLKSFLKNMERTLDATKAEA